MSEVQRQYPGGFDVILGADVVYLEAFVPHLFRTARLLISPAKQAISFIQSYSVWPETSSHACAQHDLSALLPICYYHKPLAYLGQCLSPLAGIDGQSTSCKYPQKLVRRGMAIVLRLSFPTLELSSLHVVGQVIAVSCDKKSERESDL